MLQDIRDRTHGWIAGIIISILIISFAMWGIHSYLTGSGGTDTVARVNGVQISRSMLSVATERLQRQIQLASGTLSSVQKHVLEKQALKMLVNTELLQQAAFADHYRVSATETEQYLQKMPQFQVDEKFSLERFNAVLSGTLYSPADFIKIIKTSLLIGQPVAGIRSSVFVLEPELLDAIRLSDEKRKFSYFMVPSDYFQAQANEKTVQISEADINAWYSQHKQDFLQPEQVAVEYLYLSQKNLSAHQENMIQSGKGSVADAKAPPHPFGKNGQYADQVVMHPKKQILEAQTQQAQQGDSANVSQADENQFEQLREKLIAQSYEHPESLRAAADTLGLKILSTGFFQLDKGNSGDVSENVAVRKAAFSDEVKQGNNSDLIDIAPGEVVVLRIKQYKPATILPLEVVRDRIVKLLQAQAMSKKLDVFVSGLVKQLVGGKIKLVDAAKLYHFVPVDSEFVSRDNSKLPREVVNAAFKLAGSQSFGSVRVENGYAIFMVKAIQPGDVKNASAETLSSIAKELMKKNGDLEARLYQESLIQHADVQISQG